MHMCQYCHPKKSRGYPIFCRQPDWRLGTIMWGGIIKYDMISRPYKIQLHFDAVE